jgi:hypothetical protein
VAKFLRPRSSCWTSTCEDTAKETGTNFKPPMHIRLYQGIKRKAWRLKLDLKVNFERRADSSNCFCVCVPDGLGPDLRVLPRQMNKIALGIKRIMDPIIERSRILFKMPNKCVWWIVGSMNVWKCKRSWWMYRIPNNKRIIKRLQQGSHCEGTRYIADIRIVSLRS